MLLYFPNKRQKTKQLYFPFHNRYHATCIFVSITISHDVITEIPPKTLMRRYFTFCSRFYYLANSFYYLLILAIPGGLVFISQIQFNLIGDFCITYSSYYEWSNLLYLVYFMMSQIQTIG